MNVTVLTKEGIEADDILATLATEGFVTPTPIQAQAIPLVMEGHDLIGLAQTGTG